MTYLQLFLHLLRVLQEHLGLRARLQKYFCQNRNMLVYQTAFSLTKFLCSEQSLILGDLSIDIQL